MIRRPRRGIPATLTALVALIVCALVATLAIQLISGKPPLLNYAIVAANLHRLKWSDLIVAIVGGAVALIGLVLLLAALIPGRAMVLPVADDAEDPDLVAGVSRGSFELTLRRAAAAVDGVAKAKLALRGRAIRVVVRADRADVAGIAESIRASMNARLDQLVPADRPEIRVRVHPARSAAS